MKTFHKLVNKMQYDFSTGHPTTKVVTSHIGYVRMMLDQYLIEKELNKISPSILPF